MRFVCVFAKKVTDGFRSKDLYCFQFKSSFQSIVKKGHNKFQQGPTFLSIIQNQGVIQMHPLFWGNVTSVTLFGSKSVEI